MSSLAASRADGYYFPPDYDPAKHGSLNQFRGQHPLRERASKLDEGILVIRFEMPFNVWCAGCNHLIGKGVRFNADKKQIGNYYSTKIWSFTMNAPCCGQKIEVQTDPQNTEYVVVSGGRRKVETWTAESAETIELPEQEEQAFVPRVDDTFARLEKGESDKLKAKELNSRISELYQDSNAKFKNDYELNKLLRKQNRVRRGEEKELDKKRKALGLSDDVTLLPETGNDQFAASCVEFGDPNQFTRKWQQKRKAIKSQSIFAPSALTKLGQKWEDLGHRWDSFCNSTVRRNSTEESAHRPFADEPHQSARPAFSSRAEPRPGLEGDRLSDDMEVEGDSRASTQTDDETIKPGVTADVSLANQAVNEAWPQEPANCSKLDGDQDRWACKREVKAKLWKCPLNTVPEDQEMDCSQLAKDRYNKALYEGPKLMRKYDKAKCRAQLSCNSGGAAKKNIAISQCQQKLKKTSLSDKISSALKRR